MNSSCHTYACVTGRGEGSERGGPRIPRRRSQKGMSHVTDMNESCHAYECVMSHICMYYRLGGGQRTWWTTSFMSKIAKVLSGFGVVSVLAPSSLSTPSRSLSVHVRVCVWFWWCKCARAFQSKHASRSFFCSCLRLHLCLCLCICVCLSLCLCVSLCACVCVRRGPLVHTW